MNLMDDSELLRQFENCTLPFEQWTHRCHVKVAYLYLSRYPLDEAMARVKAGIRKYNAANHVPEDGPAQGYNETTTHALMHLIAAVRLAYGKTFPVDSADGFYDKHPQLATKHILRFFYSPERRMNPRTKTEFLEPDLTALPRLTST
jgi:hypothetical protein